MWFREDLRTDDNPALRAASDAGRPVICLYILDDDTPGKWKTGGAARWWLHHSLCSLAGKLEMAGSKLLLRQGDSQQIIKEVVKKTGAENVYWNRRYAPYHLDADKELKSSLEDEGVTVHSYNGQLLHEPWEIENQSGEPYRVFTPFWKAMQKKDAIRELHASVQKLTSPDQLPQSDDISEWGLLPTKPDWAASFQEMWTPGQDGAKARLRIFLEDAINSYKDDRNRPDMESTSGLSPHLHFGEISPVQLWWATKQACAEGQVPEAQAHVFLSEIAWREFSYSLLFYNPGMLDEELNKKFTEFPWKRDEKSLSAWQRGKTGYPIVDAGMRQLWQTGWMHNRVRMIVGSFLVKHLLQDWRDGMDWFWDTLVDADIANNTASWQWIAGCGADAAPYFRIFNPMTQGEKFDPNGDYVREYVPELKEMPAKHIHTPWEAPQCVLEAAGVKLGDTYPIPIVDHAKARKQALAAYEKIK